MVNIYKINQKALLKLNEIEPSSWIFIQQPDECDFTILKNVFELPAAVLDEIPDPDEMGRIEIEDNYHLFLLRVPIKRQNSDVIFKTAPLWFIFFKEQVLTICTEELDYMFPVFSRSIKEFPYTDRANLFLNIYLEILEYFQNYLRKINEITLFTEKDLKDSIRKNIFMRIMQLEKSLVYFTTALKSNERVLYKVLRMETRQDWKIDEDLKDQVQLEHNQAVEMTNIYSNILSNMVNTFGSVITSNLNSVMTRLTIISLVLMVPTLIASIYGMNLVLPLEKNPFGFLIITGSALILTVATFIFFKIRKYF